MAFVRGALTLHVAFWCVCRLPAANLPSGYKECGCIAGDGIEAYIQTDYRPSPATDRLEIECQLSLDVRNQILFYAYAKDFGWGLLALKDGFRFDCHGAKTFFNPKPGDVRGSRLRFTIEDNKLTCSTGNTQIATCTSGQPGLARCDHDLTMFASTYADMVGNYSTYRLFLFKVYRSEVLIHDYVPACRLSDGVVGLYDTVANHFWTADQGRIREISDRIDISVIGDQQCTGRPVTPPLTVRDMQTKAVLKQGSDYLVDYLNNVSYGTAKVIVKGINDYAGETVEGWFEMMASHVFISREYCVVPYVQGDGVGSYVKLDYLPTPNDDTMEVCFAMTNSGKVASIWWSRIVNSSFASWDLLYLGNGTFRFDCDGQQSFGMPADFKLGEPYEAHVSGATLTLFGNVYTAGRGHNKCYQSLVLFATGFEDPVFGNFSTTRIYSLTVKRKGSTIVDLVPCVRKSDQAAGLFDIVTLKFFGNSGTGRLIPAESAKGFAIIIQ